MVIEKFNVNVSKVTNYFYSKLNNGSSRSTKIKKNIIASFLFRMLTVLTNLILVPLSLNYLNSLKYGIWITLSSVVSWFYLFDIGLGNGLRNKFAESIALKDKENAKYYVSTTYFLISIIVIVIYLIFLIAFINVDWQLIFNYPANLKYEVNSLIFYVFTFFIFSFLTKLVGSILTADQKPAKNDLINFIGNFLSLILTIVVSNISTGSIFLLGLSFSIATTFPYFIATIYLFRNEYKEYLPKIKYIKLKYIRELTSLSFKFFIMQIAAVVIFSTDNFIITHIFGPSEVTPYSIAFKYFNVILVLFTIITTPFWSAFTEAYYTKDFEWIKNIIRKLIKVWLLFVPVIILMVVFSNYIYRIWVGDSVKIPFSLSLFMGLFVLLSTWSNIFVYFINGVGKIKLSFYSGIVSAAINIPLAIYLAKYSNLGTSGIIIATCICVLIGVILKPLQYYKIINNKDNGVWSS